MNALCILNNNFEHTELCIVHYEHAHFEVQQIMVQKNVVIWFHISEGVCGNYKHAHLLT